MGDRGDPGPTGAQGYSGPHGDSGPQGPPVRDYNIYRTPKKSFKGQLGTKTQQEYTKMTKSV